MNKFVSASQCQMHRDRHNVGDSLWARLDDGVGGALRLEDGRRFWRRRRWHRYNGAKVRHGVERFEGERLTVVLFMAPDRNDGRVGVVDEPDDPPPVAGESARSARSGS